MDSIFAKYKNFEFLRIKYDSLNIFSKLTLVSLKKLELERNFFKTKSENLTTTNIVFEKRLENQTEKHETELLYYKEKSKGKFKTLLYGTAIGGLIVAILIKK